MIRAIIVDDEPGSRETLTELLGRYCPMVHVVASADSVAAARDELYRHRPDLLFLDIEMPFGSGFDLLDSLDDLQMEVIFITAYDHYAIKAIRYSALDYLLKPIDRDDLIEAVERTGKRIAAQGARGGSLKHILHGVRETNKDENRLALVANDSITMVPLRDIIRCQAEANYTRFYLRNGSTILMARTLKDYEIALEDRGFVRVHNSHLINLDHIKKYIRGESGEVIMSDGAVITVSRRRREDFRRRLGSK